MKLFVFHTYIIPSGDSQTREKWKNRRFWDRGLRPLLFILIKSNNFSGSFPSWVISFGYIVFIICTMSNDSIIMQIMGRIILFDSIPAVRSIGEVGLCDLK